MNFSFPDIMAAMQGGIPGGIRNNIFDEQYHCFSMAVSGRAHLEDGDKILLPPSALDVLARMQVVYPMLFELSNPLMKKRTHSGVLEFSAEEGRCYLPFWMMQNLLIEEGTLICVKNVTLPKATYVKFKPQSVDFLNISNPKAVLEVALRKFTCVTTNDVICLPYCERNYYFEITDVKPQGAASIVEADVNIDFEEPVGYQQSKFAEAEREHKLKKENEAKQAVLPNTPRELQKAAVPVEDTSGPKFVPFSGSGQRIDGKRGPASTSSSAASSSSTSSSASSSAAAAPTPPTALPAYQSTIGNKYSRNKASLSAFSGSGHKLSG